ncbi:Uncharacterised protein [Vibrio cholerae]|nr:Uncharacterised protein [Vibrio cholerae]
MSFLTLPKHKIHKRSFWSKFGTNQLTMSGKIFWR